MCGDLLSETVSLHKDSFSVSSVPNDLNIFSTGQDDDFDSNDNWTRSKNGTQNPINNHHWQESALKTNTKAAPAATTSIANRNFDLAQTFGDYHIYGINTAAATLSPLASSTTSIQTFQQQKIINSSYNNLTLLDYSGSTERIRNQLRAMAESQKRNSTSSTRSSTGSTEFSKCNFLLDEISAHFDKSLSILNDKGSFDNDDDETDHIAPSIRDKIEMKSQPKSAPPPLPPQPPPRRQHYQVKKPIATKIDRNAKASSECIEMPASYTFDRDPTNLKTSYAESLERCNIDFESSNSINLLEHEHSMQSDDRKFQPVKHSTPAKRGEMVASTPNLIQHRSDAVVSSEECLHSSSAYNSLNPLPQTPAETQREQHQQHHTKGILSAGSRNSLGKGVSFYPFVSQISWHEQSSAEETTERSDSEIR